MSDQENNDPSTDQGGNTPTLPPIIAEWTSHMLKDYKPLRQSKPVGEEERESCIAFGRTTKKALTPKVLTPKASLQSSLTTNSKYNPSNRRSRVSGTSTSYTDEGSVATSCLSSSTYSQDNNANRQRKPRLSGQESKHIGRQMYTSANGPEHLAKAQEKRRRQLTYAKNVAASKGDSVSLQIDSITRVVVQSFRKLINCERCALFLMDHTRNQLYFKPVGDPSNSSQVKVIRFSASVGVAGWCATNQAMLNIKNAYADDRFNQEIDKLTNFRTRTILCCPVFNSSGDRLIGVIQMVNKMIQGDGKALQKMAKKTKTDEKNFGYLEVFQPFCEEDEQILQKCAKQVSAALEDVLGSSSNSAISSNEEESSSDTHGKNGDTIQLRKEDSNCTSTATAEPTHSKTTSSSSEPFPYIDVADRRRKSSSARRSSIGSLVQFVSTQAEATKKDTEDATKTLQHAPYVLSEAITRFKFRDGSSGPQISARRGSVVTADPDYIEADLRRKRMKDFNVKRREGMLNKQTGELAKTAEEEGGEESSTSSTSTS